MIVPAPSVSAIRARPSSMHIAIIESSRNSTWRWLWSTRVFKLVLRVNEYSHVDWQGHYSLDKLLCLHAYGTPSATRTLSTLAITPLPTLACVLIVECVPLRDPRLGWRHNYSFFLRTLLRWWLFSVSSELQAQAHLPEFYFPLHQGMVLNFIHSAFQVALLVAASETIGVFPVQFSTTLIMPIYAAFCWITRLYVARKQLWDKADVAKALQYRTKLLKLFHMITFIIQSMTAYAVFATIFSHIPAAYQLLMAICLQFLKAWIRNKLWVKAQIHDSGGDLAAIHVATNCSFFHSIFTATCMQTSKSVYTLVFLIMWGVVKDILAFQAIRHRMNEVDRLQCTVSRLSRGSLDTRKALTQLLQRIVPSVLPPRTKSAGALTSLAVESAYIPLRVMAARLRASSSDLNPIKELTPVEIEYLDRLTQLYHCREVLLWRMFTSLFVPCFYFITALAIHQLPSAPYVGFIGMANIHVLSQRIGSQLAVRAVIGLIYGRILRRSGHLRAMDQCLFILEHQFVPLQTGCIIIALGVFAFSVTHYGNDTTFQFEWLRHHAVNTTTSLPAT